MLPLIYGYLCVPQRFRFIFRWLAMCLFILVVLGVLMLFARVIVGLKNSHGHTFLNPESHQPGSPDFIAYRKHHQSHPKEGQ